MVSIIDPFLKEKAFEVLPAPNLAGAKYSLAVPAFVADAGLKDFADIARFRKELDGKIFAIEPGNDGNALIQKMIDANQFGLEGFRMVESSEAGMLVEVQRAVDRHKFIVFLGWEPHPMNEKFKLAYLSGGDRVFGPNYGGAAVYTVVANGYLQRCPNVGALIRNLPRGFSPPDAIAAAVSAMLRGLPGKLTIRVRPAIPDTPRERIPIGVCLSASARIASANPGASRSIK